MDRALADRAVEHRVVLGLQERRADDGVAVVDEGDDLVALLGRIAHPVERHRHGLVHDREVAAADELLHLHEREVRLDPVVSQSIMKLIVPVGASTVACAFR